MCKVQSEIRKERQAKSKLTTDPFETTLPVSILTFS